MQVGFVQERDAEVRAHYQTLVEQIPAIIFIESEPGPVLDHDPTAKVPLLPTLAAYLQHGGAKAAAC